MASLTAPVLAVLVVLLAALLAAWRAHAPAGLFARPAPPHFVVCGTLRKELTDCDPALPQKNRSALMQAVADQASELVSAGGKPLLIAIGTNAFYPDVLSYKPLFDLSSEVTYRMVLIEPDNQWNRLIHFRVDEFRLRERAAVVQILNAVVAGRCKADAIFYRLNRKLWEDYDLGATFNQDGFGTSSLHRFWFENGVKEYLASKGRSADIANISAYIEEIKVPCLDPEALLRKANATARDLVMLMVDAEYEDRPIVQAFLEAGARPAYIFFETAIHRSVEGRQFMSNISEYGYSVGKQCDDAMCPVNGSNNVAAVREQRSRR